MGSFFFICLYERRDVLRVTYLILKKHVVTTIIMENLCLILLIQSQSVNFVVPYVKIYSR